MPETNPPKTRRPSANVKVGKPTRSTRAVIYARFSPRRNAEECESIETQMELCRAYCGKHGYAVAGEFQDRERSGDDEDRPGLWDAIAALGHGNVLIVYKLDRLARLVYLSEVIRRQVERAGARIESVNEQSTNGDTPEDALIRQILQAFGEYEKKVIAARTSAAMRRHQLAGRRMGRTDRLPYGWKIDPADPKRMIEDTQEVAAMAAAKALKATGMSLRQIGIALAISGYPPRTGTRWSAEAVRSILPE